MARRQVWNADGSGDREAQDQGEGEGDQAAPQNAFCSNGPRGEGETGQQRENSICRECEGDPAPGGEKGETGQTQKQGASNQGTGRCLESGRGPDLGPIHCDAEGPIILDTGLK